MIEIICAACAVILGVVGFAMIGLGIIVYKAGAEDEHMNSGGFFGIGISIVGIACILFGLG